MTYHGKVRNGQIVLDPAVKLPEGLRVRIEPVAPEQSPAPRFHPVSPWDGPPGELDRLPAEVQALRDADMIGQA